MNTFISHGPVQIINAERTCAADIPDDCVLLRGSAKRSWSTLLKIGSALGALVIGVATVLHVAELAAIAVAGFLGAVEALAADMVARLTSTVTWIVSTSTTVCWWLVRLVLGGWMVGRAAEFYLLLERWLGGGPRRLIIVSKLFAQRRIEVEVEVALRPQPEPPQQASSTPQLAAGKSRELAAINSRGAFAAKRQEPTSSPI